jgi:XTP/dITP diphosphohydrolase
VTHVYAATTNLGKLRELNDLGQQYEISVLPANQDREMPEVDEDGDTFEANAAKKAIEYSQHLPGQLVIADDSGLEANALNGAPGVFSARYAARDEHHKPTDADNNYKLLAELEKLHTDDRTARFVCVIAAARDGQLLTSFRGEALGEILISPLGKRGFGYDPLFYVKEANQTFAEMNSETKAKYSHRGAAFRKFLDWYLRQR